MNCHKSGTNSPLKVYLYRMLKSICKSALAMHIKLFVAAKLFNDLVDGNGVI